MFRPVLKTFCSSFSVSSSCHGKKKHKNQKLDGSLEPRFVSPDSLHSTTTAKSQFQWKRSRKREHTRGELTQNQPLLCSGGGVTQLPVISDETLKSCSFFRSPVLIVCALTEDEIPSYVFNANAVFVSSVFVFSVFSVGLSSGSASLASTLFSCSSRSEAPGRVLNITTSSL